MTITRIFPERISCDFSREGKASPHSIMTSPKNQNKEKESLERNLKRLRDRARKLESMEERYRILFNAIFVQGIGKAPLSGRFIEVNEIACRRLGYSREDLLNLTLKDIGDVCESADSDHLNPQLLDGKNVPFEMMHRTREDSEIRSRSMLNCFT